MKLFGRKTQDPVKETVSQPAAEKFVQQSSVEKNSTTAPAKVSAILPRTNILVKPLVSEKATIVNALNKYVFVVSASANKSEIKKAIKELYGVMPISVNIINKLGKFTFTRGRMGKTKDIKKAIITLKKGESIKIYEGI